MVAAFANSPVHAGRDTGWKSGRQRVWQHLDRERTADADRAPTRRRPGREYALDAPLMLRRRDGDDWRVEPRPHLPRLGRPPTSRPTAEDLAVHMTTLFPPVRPRGWFEVRYLDAQPWQWWPVPMAVLTALLEDPEASAAAPSTPAPGSTTGTAAARDGLAAPGLQDAALACFDAALRRAGGAAASTPTSSRWSRAFRDRYVARGRSPADDRPSTTPDLEAS